MVAPRPHLSQQTAVRSLFRTHDASSGVAALRGRRYPPPVPSRRCMHRGGVVNSCKSPCACACGKIALHVDASSSFGRTQPVGARRARSCGQRYTIMRARCWMALILAVCYGNSRAGEAPTLASALPPAAPAWPPAPPLDHFRAAAATAVVMSSSWDLALFPNEHCTVRLLEVCYALMPTIRQISRRSCLLSHQRGRPNLLPSAGRQVGDAVCQRRGRCTMGVVAGR